ncbi:MAG: hypothetical protein WCJ17_03880 [bacterium]
MKPQKLILSILQSLCVCLSAYTQLEYVKTSILNNVPPQKTIQETIVDPKTKQVIYPDFSMSTYEKYSSLLNILNEQSPPDASNDTIDQKTIDDLQLFCFSSEKPCYSVLENLYRGHSLNGKIALARMLANPIASRAALEKKQKLLLYILNNPSVTETLMSLFKKLSTCEDSLYSLWNQNDILYSAHVKKEFYRGSFKKYQTPKGKHWLEFHRHRLMLEPLMNIIISDLQGAAAAGFFTLLLKGKTSTESFIPSIPHAAYLIGRKISGKKAWTERSDLERKESMIQLGLKLCATALGAGANAIFTLPQWKAKVAAYKSFVIYVRKRFQNLMTYSHLIKEIYTQLKKHPQLLSACDPESALQLFMSGENAEQKMLMNTLAKPVFKSSSTSFHKHLGTVLHVVPLFLKVKHSFAKVFEAIGACEAFLSSALFFKERQSTAMPWSFASYESKDRPYINLIEYAHPLIPVENVILNSLTLGIQNHGLIVTGPNKSGKSINIRAITLCILLAQTLGMCPAQKAFITPMHKILSYLNPVDNIAEGKSLFQAETERIKNIVDDACSLNPTEFSFIVADELLSGTAPTEGEAATWGIAYGLAQLPNCMPIIATHFPKMTTLPEKTNNFFTNYHVSVIKKPDGSFAHPFKLEPGRSHQVIALDLARNAGFDSDILNSADGFLNRKGFKRGRTL